MTSNSAAQSGGGVYLGVLANCTLSGNSAKLDQGGGVYGSTLSNCTLTGNWAVLGGGAADGRLTNCLVMANSAEFGGGSYNDLLYNCIIQGNSAHQRGGAIAESVLFNCTVTSNSPSVSGGGAFGFAPMLYNCIVYFNTAPQGANSDPIGNYGVLNVHCCTTPQPTNGFGNITNAPLFVDYAGGNLRLQSNSPCINAGLNAYAPGPTDLDGNPRIVSGTVDIRNGPQNSDSNLS